MSWVRIDDGMAFNSKIVAAGNSAVGAWVRLLAWCSSQLTDGFVPAHIADVIAGDDVERLCVVGLLDRVEQNYQLHDYLDYNPSAVEVRKQRDKLSKARAVAGRKGGKQNGSKTEANGDQFDSTLLKQNEAPSRPVPSRPDPRVETGATLWPEAIGGAADLERAVSEWGWQAGCLDAKTVAKVRRVVEAAPIARHEHASAKAKAEAKVSASDGPGRVRYFLGVVEGSRLDAADEAAKPRGPGAAPDPDDDGPLPIYLRQVWSDDLKRMVPK